MSFGEAIATQPSWVQWWLLWMGIVILATIIGLVFSKQTRIDALIIFVTNLAVYFAMMWLYQQVGFVRLLGIVHVVLWTPLAIYLVIRLKETAIVTPFRQLLFLFLLTISLSLVFDYADVVRYFFW